MYNNSNRICGVEKKINNGWGLSQGTVWLYYLYVGNDKNINGNNNNNCTDIVVYVSECRVWAWV